MRHARPRSLLAVALAGVLVLSSCSSAASGGGGASGADTVALQQDILETADTFLPEEALFVLSEAMDGASATELESLQAEIDAFVTTAESYYYTHITPRIDQNAVAASGEIGARSVLVVDDRFSLRRGVENLEAVLVQAADYVDIGQALELAGIGYAVEATVQYGSGVSGSVLGQDLSVTLSEGIGTGTSYDFINMTRYAYDSTLAGGAVTLGLGPSVDLPASPTIEFSGGVVTSLTFNHEIGQSYEDCVSRTGGVSLGIGADIVAGLGFSAGIALAQEINTTWTPDDLPEEPSGLSDGETAVGILAKLTLSGGAEIGVEGNFSGEIGWAYADPDPASVYAYIPSREISRLHAIRAALSMSGDILSDGGAAGGPLPWIASGFALLHGFFMDIDEPIPDVPSAGGTYSAQALIDLGPFVMAGYRTNYEYDGTLQVIGYHFLETGEYRALMYDSSAGAVRYYGNLSASWKVVGGVLHLGNSAIDYWEALPGSLESFIDGVANGTWVQVDVSGTYYPSVSGSSVPGDPGASIDLTPVFMPR
jgi:hypothetical protein